MCVEVLDVLVQNSYGNPEIKAGKSDLCPALHITGSFHCCPLLH